MLRLGYACHAQRAVGHLRIAPEHPAQLENTHPRLLAVGVVLDVGHQAAAQARTHPGHRASNLLEPGTASPRQSSCTSPPNPGAPPPPNNTTPTNPTPPNP